MSGDSRYRDYRRSRPLTTATRRAVRPARSGTWRTPLVKPLTRPRS
ncbi:hypothetical protein ACFPM0_22315 [Pseudonocardia sulfidoxydans]